MSGHIFDRCPAVLFCVVGIYLRTILGLTFWIRDIFDLQGQCGAAYRGLELMAGCCNFSIAMIDTKQWVMCAMDVVFDKHLHDLANTSVQGKILKSIAGGVWHYVHFGLDCLTWTRLANPPYRTNAWLDGIPGLRKDKMELLALHNNLFRFMLAVLSACAAQVIPVSLENGESTMLWLHHLLAPWLSRYSRTTVVTDYCQYGMPYRKRTRFLCSHDGLQPMVRRCKCPGKHREVLKGSKVVKGRWQARSKMSQAYPPKLCFTWAHCVCGMAKTRFG